MAGKVRGEQELIGAKSGWERPWEQEVNSEGGMGTPHCLRSHLSGVIMVSIAPPVGGVLVARGAVTMEKSVLLYASECHR
jgi:hypothetical protein